MFKDTSIAVTATMYSSFWELFTKLRAATFKTQIDFNSATTVLAVAATGNANVAVFYIFVTDEGEPVFSICFQTFDSVTKINANQCVSVAIMSSDTDLESIVNALTFGPISLSPAQIALLEAYYNAFTATMSDATPIIDDNYSTPFAADPLTPADALYTLLLVLASLEDFSLTMGSENTITVVAIGQAPAQQLVSGGQ